MRAGSLFALLLTALLSGCAAYPTAPVYGAYAGPAYGPAYGPGYGYGYGYGAPPVVGGVIVGGYRPWAAPPPVYRPPVAAWGRPPGYWGARPLPPAGGWAGRPGVPGGWAGRPAVPGGWAGRPVGQPPR